MKPQTLNKIHPTPCVTGAIFWWKHYNKKKRKRGKKNKVTNPFMLQ